MSSTEMSSGLFHGSGSCFTDKTTFKGSGKNFHLVERFTRVDAGTLLYEYTIDDPESFTKPWSAAIPMTKTEVPMFEYACHEGNYAMTNILGGARAEENASEAAKKGIPRARTGSARRAVFMTEDLL